MRKEIAGRIAAGAVCLILMGSTTGCGTLLRQGLEQAGVESSTRAPSVGASSVGSPVPERPPPVGVRSIYQHAPTFDWTGRYQSLPYSITTGLFSGPAFDTGCQPIPIGLRQLLPVPNGAPAAPLERIGPFEIGVQGPIARLFSPGYSGYFDRLRDGELFYGGGALADYSLMCGFRAVLYLRVSASGTTPIAVNR